MKTVGIHSLVFVFLFILSILFSKFSLAQNSLRLSKIDDDGPLEIISEQVIREAYQRIGIQIEVYDLPAKRALYMSNSGETDGELIRVAGIDEKFFNLKQIPIAITYLEIAAFSKKLDFKIEGWDSISPYQIGISRGIFIIEKRTKGMDVELARASSELMKKLAAGRTEIVVTALVDGLKEIRKHSLKGIRILKPSLEKVPLYHYLHEKHAKLIPIITKSLREMEKEGRIAIIQKKVMDELIDNTFD